MKILSYGSLNIDHVYSVEDIVKSGKTIATKSYFKNPGGKGLNLSTAISKAGSDVYHAGSIGDDGDCLLDILKENSVDITYIDKIDGVSGQAIIQVSNSGENSIIVNGGTNLKQSKSRIREVLSNFEPGDMLVIQNEINLLDFTINEAYDRGLTIVLNPSPFNHKISDVDLSKITFLVLNQIEGKEFTGLESPNKIVEKLLAKYPNMKIILTLGSLGVIYASSEETLTLSAYRTKVVDTTAAGDTFLGYFISSITRGKTVEYSLKTASIAVSRTGASKSIPLMAEVILP